MYPSGGLGGSGRDSAGHPAGSIDDSLFNGLDARGRSTSRYPYSNIVPARPAPPPPTSGMSGLHRRGTSGGARGDAFSRMTSRRGSLGIPPSSVSGLSASRPMGFSGDLELPHLEPLVPSTRRSGGGHRSREVTTPGLGSGRLGGGLGMPGGLLDAGPSLLSQSQPIDIAPLSPLGGINDWRNRISPGSPLENPTLRETRREARHRARDDWERDAELHPNVSLESDLEDSTDGETDSPIGSQVQPRRRRNSLRRTPEISDLRGGDDSGISLNTNANRSLSLQDSDDFGLSGLDLDVGRGLTIDSGGRTFLGSNGGLNGHRARRSAFSGTGTTPLQSLPQLDLGPGAMAPLRRSRHPIGPPPTAPLPLPPSQAGLPGLGGHGTFGGLGALPPLPGPSRRRSSVQEQSSSFGGYTDPFAPLPRIPGQHRIREHMVEFTDGDYVVRIRHAQRARQQQQEEQRNRSGTGGSNAERLAEARRLGF